MTDVYFKNHRRYCSDCELALRKKWNVWQCPGCKKVFTTNPPREEELGEW